MTRARPLMCALALALAAPAASHATAPADTTSKVDVPYRDIDLSRPRNASIMLWRLDRAAIEACGASDFSWSEYRRVVRNSDCYAASLDRAVAELNAPLVSRLYERQARATN